MFPIYKFRYANTINIKVDLKKTRYLKTAIIENEWINSLKNDICDGPNYLKPLTEFISLIFFKFFFKVPE